MKFTWVMTYCDADRLLKDRSVEAMKRLYPDADGIVLYDRPDFSLKVPEWFGFWTQRWMYAALECKNDIIVKIDPDTRAVNAVTEFPETDIFGYTAPKNTYWPGSKAIICGAAIGFYRDVVERIIYSGDLRDDKYSFAPYASEMGTPAKPVSLQDAITADVIKRHGFTTGDWPGLHIRFSWDKPEFAPPTATFVHPVRS